MDKKRVGILTSGGDCPGLNAVIRGAVKSCHQLGYDCVGFLKGYEGLYDPVQYVQLTPKSTVGILKQGGTILGSTNKGRFAATVGVQDRVDLDPDLLDGVKSTIEQLSLDGLICVGGDGSLSVAQQFHEAGIPVVGVPKTIDNDLSATAFTFGFDSAIDCATDALDRLHTTAASHERIMVLEVMGRHAGWIALHSGIAGGGDVILIPEVPWSFDNVCQKILHRESQGKKFTLVVVAEGAELPDGGHVGEHIEGQQMKLGGVGRAVADGIASRLHRETRLCVLGHLQRGGAPTTFDRVLATQFGAHAVRLIKEGKFGQMICSRPPEMTSVPIMEAVNELRTVDPHGPAVQAARAMGISFGDRPADEIGQDVFDKPEDIENHTPIKVQEAPVHFESTPEDEAREDLMIDMAADSPEPPVETPEAEPVEVAEVEEPTVEETPVVEPVAEVAEAPAPEPEAEPEPEVVEEVAEEAPAVVETVEEVSEASPVETTEAEPISAEPVVEEVATEDAPVEEKVVEEVAQAEPSEDEIIADLTETVADLTEAALEISAPPETAVEESAEAAVEPEVLGAETIALTPEETAAPEAEAAAEADAQEATIEPAAEEVATADEVLSTEPEPATPTETAEEPTVVEAETSAEETKAAEPVVPDQLQADLAKRIAAAAAAAQPESEPEPEASEASGGLDVAELVKQKLAAAQITPEPKKAAAEAPAAEAVDETESVEAARRALEQALAN